MKTAEERYRRLPGRRRGILSGATLWMGSDHILLVKSAWFREEYNRFYLREIQSIVVAPRPLFYVSRPMLIFAFLWTFVGAAVLVSLDSYPRFYDRSPLYRTTIEWGAGTLVMLALWLGISLAGSCRCRLRTAVGQYDLPSLYRRRTARRFLKKLQPLIEQAQGAAPAGWVEIARSLESAAPPAPPPLPRTEAPAHTMAADLFVLSLFAASVASLYSARLWDERWFRLENALNLAQLICAVILVVQYARGRIAPALQRLAVAAIVLSAMAFYGQIFAFPYMNAPAATGTYHVKLAVPPALIVFRQVNGILGLVLGFIAAAMVLRGSFGRVPAIIKD